MNVGTQVYWSFSSLNNKLTPWQKSSGSLTARLKASGRFKVKVLSSGYAKPTMDEAQALGLTRPVWVYVRTVCLLVDDVPRVVARSVARFDDVRGEWHRLRQQGSRPLGEMLWAKPTIRRGRLQFANLQSSQQLHRVLRQHWPDLPKTIPVRRAVFRLKKKPLIVMEAFLPAILELPCL